jgi:hypothetical protein
VLVLDLEKGGEGVVAVDMQDQVVLEALGLLLRGTTRRGLCAT